MNESQELPEPTKHIELIPAFRWVCECGCNNFIAPIIEEYECDDEDCEMSFSVICPHAVKCNKCGEKFLTHDCDEEYDDDDDDEFDSSEDESWKNN